MKRICECGHESCFHRKQDTGLVALFGGGQGRSCMGRDDKGRDCACLRFTIVDNE